PLLGRSLRKTVVKISNFKATGLLRRYAPRNDGPKNRTVQREIIKKACKQPINIVHCALIPRVTNSIIYTI
ncbi:hypothetical protein SCQ64_13515, partial [Legionella pneumophila serogroup 1]